jgi:N-acyl-D-aspartate/D-glutamate deacylase
MTGLPAEVFGIEGRGAIREGAIADLVVFDLERLADPATFDAPHQLSQGMVQVLVNGTFAIEDESFTDAMAGQVLHRAGAALSHRMVEPAGATVP